MYRKILFIVSFLIFLSLGLSLRGVLAKNDDSNSDELPEIEGTYDVPGHPNLKVRVFVYHPKGGRPSPQPSPTPTPVNIVCPDDTASVAVVPPTGWKLPSSWSYSLNTQSVPSSVGSNNLQTISSNAFNEFQAAIKNKVNITKASDTAFSRAKLDGQNIISWGRTSGSALAVTYTWYYTATGEVAEVDTIMNQKFPWFWNTGEGGYMCTDANSYDAQDILTHELGHWYGLEDVYTSEYTENTMFGYGSKGETKKDTLTFGDASSVLAIYK